MHASRNQTGVSPDDLGEVYVREMVKKLMTNTVKAGESELPGIFDKGIELETSSIFIDTSTQRGVLRNKKYFSSNSERQWRKRIQPKEPIQKSYKGSVIHGGNPISKSGHTRRQKDPKEGQCHNHKSLLQAWPSHPKALAETGKWHIIMASRDFLKAEKAAKSAGIDKENYTIVHLDLASLDSVRQFADSFKQSGRPLDVLVCNAAIYQPTAKEPAYSAEGFEISRV